MPVFNPDASALLVLDMQEVFLNRESHAFIPSAPAIINGINALIDGFQLHRRPVILTRHTNTAADAGAMATWWRDLMDPSDPLSGISDAIHSGSSRIIEKHQYDAFHGTQLAEILKNQKVSQVVIAGVMTHICCDSTARSAFHRGFQVFFTIDGTATYNRRLHAATLETLAHCCAAPVLVQQILDAMGSEQWRP